MYKEIRVFPGQPFEKATRADLMSCKALELPHHPGPKRLIDVSKQGMTAPMARIVRSIRSSPVGAD